MHFKPHGFLQDALDFDFQFFTEGVDLVGEFIASVFLGEGGFAG
jgi:hypothetical protein